MTNDLRERAAIAAMQKLIDAQHEINELVKDMLLYGVSIQQNGKRIDPLEFYKNPEPDWIPWHGGECPVDPDTLIEIQFRDGTTEMGGEFSNLNWRWTWDVPKASRRDIIRYRVVGGGE